ncbi:MAG: glycosyltransferase family 39 protein [Streptosporangiaceae bacterium]
MGLFNRTRIIPLAAAVAALAAGAWGTAEPSFWRDEAATLSVARRSIPEIFDLLQHIDAVHGLYYLLMHVFLAAVGSDGSELAARLPSIVAGAVTAGATAAIGRRLGGDLLGLLAGLLAASAPMLARFAQEARPYAMETALATLATYLLVRALDREGYRPFAGYAAAVVVMAYLNIFSLFLLPAHALTVCLVDRTRFRHWLAAAAAAGTLVLPLAVIALPQSGDQLYWIVKPSWTDVGTLITTFSGGPWLIAPVVLLIIVALTHRAGPGTDLRLVAAPWLLLPPATLLIVSQVHPFYQHRYLLFCVPAVALLVSAGLCRFPLWAALPGAVALLASMVSLQVPQHAQDSRADDIRAVAEIISHRDKPGDAFYFGSTFYRTCISAYPRVFAPLRDISLRRSAVEAADLPGTVVDPATLAQRLRGADRVWLITRLADPGTPMYTEDLARRDLIWDDRRTWKRVHRWKVRGAAVALWKRR